MKVAKLSVTVAIDGRDAPFEVIQLAGTEAISEPFAFEVTFGARELLDLSTLVGRPAVVTIDAGPVRHVHGLVARVEELEPLAHEQRYRATLRPEAWLLGERVDTRAFQDATVPEIVAKVCADAGLARVRFALRRSYARRELCVQYRESDLQLVSRLLEEEGIFFFFEHDEGAHTWVFADDPSASRDAGVGAIPFVPPSGGLDGGPPAVESLRLEQAVRPGRVAVRTLAFDAPRAPADDVATRERADLAHYEPGPPIRAADRLEALRVTRDVARGTARTPALLAGAVFTLDGHPREASNRGWLPLRVEHVLARNEGGHATYASAFVAIPDDVPFRPERRTPKPRIAGPQPADVVGPPGSEIHCDAAGRVWVRMRWERDLAAPPCWVHVAQSASGAGFGSVTIPRVGSAVLVGFLDGDPDRPIVTGRVYDATRPHPYALPGDKTKTGLVTRSSPGGEGRNELRFEDAAGREEVYLRGERDVVMEARHDRSASVGRNDLVRVGASRTQTIAAHETTSVGASRTLQVIGAETTTVGGAQSVRVGGAQSVTVAGARTLVVGTELHETVNGNAERHVVGNDVVGVGRDQQTTVDGARQTTVYGADTTTVTGTQTLTVSGNLQQIVEGQATQVLGGLELAVEQTLVVASGGEVKVESSSAAKIGAPVIVLSANTLTLRAYEKIVLEVGSSVASADDRPRLEITTSGVYVTNGDAKEKLSGEIVRINC